MNKTIYITCIILCFLILSRLSAPLNAQNKTLDCYKTLPEQFDRYIELRDFCNAKKGVLYVKNPELGSPVYDVERAIMSFIVANEERLQEGLNKKEQIAIEAHDILREIIMLNYKQAIDPPNNNLASRGSAASQFGTGLAAKCIEIEVTAGTKGFELPKYFYVPDRQDLRGYDLPNDLVYRPGWDYSGPCDCIDLLRTPLREEEVEVVPN